MSVKLPIYLDYMATTPVDPMVAKAMARCLELSGNFGNPASSTHSYGWRAKEAVEKAREQVAKTVNASPKEIVFTSGATEANNLALIGAAQFYARKGRHIITSKTEHKATLDVCRHLEQSGFEVTYLTPQPNGLIDPASLEAVIRPDTILVSLMQVNNEIGVIQDIAALTRITRPKGIVFHCDAAQSVGKVLVDVRALDVDLLSLSAHKAYGPKGVGALYVRRAPRVRLTPLFYGGGHEQGLRPGTLATHQIVGMGEAFERARHHFAEESARLATLRDRLWQGIQALPEVTRHGDVTHCVANVLNVGFGFVEGESLLLAIRDLAVSSGSACTSATIEPSHVLLALGVPDLLAHSSVRFSIGRFTTEEDIDYAISHIQKNVTWLRNMSPLWEDYLNDRGEDA